MRLSKVIIIGFTVATLLVILYMGYSFFGKTPELPYVGEPGHTVGQFSFQDQSGRTITEKNLDGKVAVVEYFFTTCPGICKVMNKNLYDVYKAYGKDPKFIMLSHTVDPEMDSVPVLAAYAEKMKVDNSSNWHFLTGNKYDLYKAARTDYLLAVEEADVKTGSENDFIHTQYVALLDNNRRIRGFYDATDKQSIQKLLRDIKTLERSIDN